MDASALEINAEELASDALVVCDLVKRPAPRRATWRR